jgi:hypothetical protein
MDILITGARSPAALEWARICLESGHRVWLADSLHYPLSRYINGAAGYLLLPPANCSLTKYTQALEKIIVIHDIQLIIPTCEEIFFLSKARKMIQTKTQWFMPEETLLFTLHNKYLSIDSLQNLGEIITPQTRLCTSIKNVVDDKNTILKPVYSRFGQHVVRQIDIAELTALPISNLFPWVQQQKITGTALCNYALFDHGRLISHQAYLPLYCLNQSAATYFKPYSDDRLLEFVIQFGRRTQFHGQVAFDFIEQEGNIYVIECNPRATSGIHLLAPNLTLSADGSLEFKPGKICSHMIGGMVPLYFGLSALRKCKLVEFIKDWRLAKNVFSHSVFRLKSWALLLAFLELFWLSRKLKRPITETSTHDIEWNAEDA